MTRVLSLLLVPFLLVALAGSTCESGSGTPPTVSITLNGIPSPVNELLVVPPAGFVVSLGFSPGSAAVDPATLQVGGNRWGGANLPPLDALFSASATGAVAEIPFELALEHGTYTLFALVRDVDGRVGTGSFSFAVRGFPAGTPPIDTGQQIWLDFASDRDGIPGPDFPLDLQSFGLASPLAPAVADTARALVIESVLARTGEAYGPDASGFSNDPVSVVFTDSLPGSGDVTRICVGGEDPAGGSTIGSVPIDINNANRAGLACGTIPPTGVFPRELLVFQNQASFQTAFDPLRPARGGVPIGENVWDAVVLDPLFDPGLAPPDAVSRHAVVTNGIQVFADALGSIIAHESAHALGLVPPGAPGLGLFGGSDGAAFTHSLEPDGSTPSGNFLMKAGNTFTFSKLAGLGGFDLPAFREIELAYLHDRVVLAPQVKALLPPPAITAVSPSVVTGSSALLTITGTSFAATPYVRALLPSFVFSTIAETWQSPQQMTTWVVRAQMIPGLYDLELTNPDGQQAVLPASLWVP